MTRPVPPYNSLQQCWSGSEGQAVIADVVFVHGLTGDCWSTWTGKSSKKCWPRDLLPSRLENTRIWTYSYDADVIHMLSRASQNTIAQHASNLASVLANKREATGSETLPLFFVAHSLGGLLVKKAFTISERSPEQHVESVANSTRGFIFLGVPHRGSHHANWGKLCANLVNVAKRVNTRIIGVLRPDSEVLAEITRDFSSSLRRRNENNQVKIDISCFAEELEFLNLGKIVPDHSAFMDSYNQMTIHADHSDMTKFESDEAPGYINISDDLYRWCRKARRQEVTAIGTTDQPQPLSGRGPLLLQGGNFVSGFNSGVAGSNIANSTIRFG